MTGLEDYIVVQITFEQWLADYEKRYWLTETKSGRTLEQYLGARQLASRDSEFGRTSFRAWALILKNDTETAEHVSTCATYRRPACAKTSTGTFVEGFCQSVAHVYTPPAHRKKGFARRMMVLLHEELTKDAIASALYSDVGDFYRKAARVHPEEAKALGWQITSPRQVEWKTQDLQDARPSSDWVTISKADLPEIAKRDAAMLRTEVETSSSSTFSVLPSPAQFDWFATLSEADAQAFNGKDDSTAFSTWGVQHGQPGSEDWAFAVWGYHKTANDLLILRLQCRRAQHFQELVGHAAAAAREHGLGRITAWNVAEELLEGSAWKNVDRADHLPALAWYGDGDLPKRWIANENWCWC